MSEFCDATLAKRGTEMTREDLLADPLYDLVRRNVDQMPPLSPEKTERLKLIFSGEVSSGAIERLGREALERSRQPVPASEGHIYVIAFTTNVIKVGRSSGEQTRLSHHRREAARLGIEVSEEWVSVKHAEWQANEAALIRYCEANGARRGLNKSEYFNGLDFAAVQAFATTLVPACEQPEEAL